MGRFSKHVRRPNTNIEMRIFLFLLLPLFTQGILQYHNYEALTSNLQKLASENADLLTLYNLTETSEEGRPLWVMKISTDGKGQRKALKPMVKYVANMHGNE